MVFRDDGRRVPQTNARVFRTLQWPDNSWPNLNWSVENEAHCSSRGIIVCSVSKFELHWEHGFHRFVPKLLALGMFARVKQQIERSILVVRDENLSPDEAKAKPVELLFVELKNKAKELTRVVP